MLLRRSLTMSQKIFLNPGMQFEINRRENSLLPHVKRNTRSHSYVNRASCWKIFHSPRSGIVNNIWNKYWILNILYFITLRMHNFSLYCITILLICTIYGSYFSSNCCVRYTSILLNLLDHPIDYMGIFYL